MKLYDTLSAAKRPFVPINRECVRLYVCGPTVYSLAHIGNARSAVVYDMLFRLLRELYLEVCYVRNITDIDDKIINAAKDSGQDIDDLTTQCTKWFHEDMQSLNCLHPTFEPRATGEISSMLQLIGKLIESGYAYVKNGTVYFSVKSCSFYGKLSGRKIEDMISGHRVDLDTEKLHPGDFVLWKPATKVDLELGSYWSSPWGDGRPGWHIECSAMSYRYLGENFDIHGGGADLMFPHHENEIAQSCCAFPSSNYANYWVHNGFLTVNGGEKMSKSLGNIVTVRELLGSGIKGEVIRYVFLSTHYRKPLDWNSKAVQDAEEALGRIYRACEQFSDTLLTDTDNVRVCNSVMESLQDDMNTPKAISALHELVTEVNKTEDAGRKLELARVLSKSARLLGLLQESSGKFLRQTVCNVSQEVLALVERRKEARSCKDFELADRIRDKLLEMGIALVDEKDGSTSCYRK